MDIRPLSCAAATLFPAIQMCPSGPDAAESEPDLPAAGLMTRNAVWVWPCKPTLLACDSGWLCQLLVTDSAPESARGRLPRITLGSGSKEAGQGAPPAPTPAQRCYQNPPRLLSPLPL